MLKKTGVLLLLLVLLSVNIYNTNYVKASSLPRVDAAAAAVVDVDTGQVLYNHRMNHKLPPASTTKILTTIIAIEEGELNEMVTVSRRAAYQEGSSIWLQEGEKLPLEDLLYGVMLASGNDAAVAVAEHISGSVKKFSELMNKRAKEIGATNSNFLNPSGLPQSGHYSTAHDLAMIMRYALKNDIFARITSTKYKTISWPGKEWDRGLRNHNKLLWKYPDITGGKTGYTRAAGRCLVASAKRDNRHVVAVVLNCPNDWVEIRKLLDYGLNNFKKIRYIKKGQVLRTLEWTRSREKTFKLVTGEDLDIVVPEGGSIKIKKEIVLNPDITLPINKGDVVGELILYSGQRIIGKADVISGNDLNFNSIFLRFWHKISSRDN
ncbi:D-alanyl-D-alanine carboxypeptidase family protein [Halothermothrix orenii]|uniref:serine-type D-Ala-D-Ala carboxypeptidase n=1 Tax=Halothermothrix orenii (strain H 168 / OCM 544 / DSM 9562) TaxID=373903 RepID=B8CW10_HALOH|nr:D-alanyl-D-alanine carboxypeptidase family protein [Halothermothrix orenii]ACL69479.1 Serine-type D-Ala-D-Ala carboxypeptidase [Halothermothrix orenii H 168]